MHISGQREDCAAQTWYCYLQSQTDDDSIGNDWMLMTTLAEDRCGDDVLMKIGCIMDMPASDRVTMDDVISIDSDLCQNYF